MDIICICKNDCTPFIGEKLECQKEGANELDPYAVAIVKRTAGCTENQGTYVVCH